MEQLQSNIQYYLLIYEEIFPHFLIYWETLPHKYSICNCSTLNFLKYWGKIVFFFINVSKNSLLISGIKLSP